MSIKDVQKYSIVATICKQKPTTINTMTGTSTGKEENIGPSVMPVEA